jgi:acyl-CoA synthetase (NDP forming)
MSKSEQNSPNKDHFLYSFLNPKSIAVFGANNNLLSTMGSMQLRNIRAGKGVEEIYPVHPRLEKVQGFKAYKSVFDIPVIPEFAFIILPPKAVIEVMEECGQKGIKHLIITSGGFREIGPEGIKLSSKLDQIAHTYNMRFIGPNCLGIYNAWYRYPEKKNAFINTFWPYIIPRRGNISLISQSGTIAAQTFWHAKEVGAKISKSISVGNERNIDLVDFIEYFKDDNQTQVIGLYIEEIKRGKEFIKIAKRVSLKKPIVAMYAGGTQAASRSTMSHTGSLGASQKIIQAVFESCGIISTNSVIDFLHYLRTLSFAQEYNIFPKGKKVGIVTDSGGSGSMMAKTAELYGLKMPEFTQELKNILFEIIPPTASATNPVDVTFDTNFVNLLYKLPKIVMKSGEVDAVIVYGVFDFDEVLDTMEQSGMIIDEKMKGVNMMIERAVLKPIKHLMTKYSIPVYFAGPFPYKYPWFQKFLSHDIPIFELWDLPTKCLKILCNYAQNRKARLENSN